MWNSIVGNWKTIVIVLLVFAGLVVVWKYVLSEPAKQLRERWRIRKQSAATVVMSRTPQSKATPEFLAGLMKAAIVLLIANMALGVVIGWMLNSKGNLSWRETRHVLDAVSWCKTVTAPQAAPAPSALGFNTLPPTFNCAICRVNTDDASSTLAGDDTTVVWTGIRCVGYRQCEDECVADCHGDGDQPVCGKCRLPN